MKEILLSITGEKNSDWQSKLAEINELRIDRVAVFLSRFDKKERDNFYRFLSKSSVKEVPFVHLREDVTKEEVAFFIDRFRTRYFNIHEEHFKLLDHWQGYWDRLYLEMDYNSQIAKDVKVEKIGGFCVDLAHFKAALDRGAEEACYIFLRKNKIKFACNHLSGYSPERQEDIHFITDLKEFSYLSSLPQYVFGQMMALEIDNSIQEQMKFRECISRLLND